MKINYEKSEVFTVGLQEGVQQVVVDALNYKLGTFPMKYLGLPVSEYKITKAQLKFASDKIEKILGTWQCEYLSSGGKSTLIDSCLSSIPLYTMGVYYLYEGNFQMIDSIRSRFYWQGTSKKRKYRMIKWEALIRPKELGGLGFTDVRVMNTCLMSKWIDKLERGDNSMCCSLLRRKYLGEKSIFQINNRKGSQFWRSLLDLRVWYQRGRMIVVNCGKQTKFWDDTWIGGCPLRIHFPTLFQSTVNPELSVADAHKDGQWMIEFRRQIVGTMSEEWHQLQDMLADITLTEGGDKVYWGLEQSGKYTAKSLYKFMTTGGIRDLQMMAIWKCNIPLKVKIFMWMAMHDRIQSKVQLKKKKWSGPLEYLVCGKVETADHILFQCPVAVFLWSFLRDTLGWSKSPTSCADFLCEIVRDGRGINKKINLFLCAGALWTI
jgi:hypothetical protein